MKKFDDFINEAYIRKVELVSKRNSSLSITFDVIDSRIQNIINNANIRFPYVEGRPFNRDIETWCCNNNFLLDGKDTCPEEKIFGIRKKDIPQGHPLRTIYLNKFR
jgi:hypothetical protein